MLDNVIQNLPKPLHMWIQIVKEGLFKGYMVQSYSVDGIDLILSAELASTKNIFFVDVGANHPFWSSNSYLLYKKGARGINIDATPGIMDIFRISRPRDINLEFAVSDSSKKMTYLIFDFAAYNGFEGTFETERLPYINLKKKVQIIPKKLSWILNKYLPTDQELTVLFIDTEGHDMNVLRSNNWDKYHPRYIVTEWFTTSTKDIFSSEVYKFLVTKGYELIANTQTNLLFRKK